MKKLIPFALALASLAVLPSAASAITTGSRDISISTRGRSQDVGVLVFQAPEVSEDGADLDDLGFEDELDACTYYVKWTNDADLPSRTNLVMLEISTIGNADCDENADEDFDTLIFADPNETNRGFNRQQQRKEINAFVLGESEDGELSGVIQFEDGNTYSVHVDADP